MGNLKNKVIHVELSEKVWSEIILNAQVDVQFGMAQIQLVEDDY